MPTRPLPDPLPTAQPTPGLPPLQPSPARPTFQPTASRPSASRQPNPTRRPATRSDFPLLPAPLRACPVHSSPHRLPLPGPHSPALRASPRSDSPDLPGTVHGPTSQLRQTSPSGPAPDPPIPCRPSIPARVSPSRTRFHAPRPSPTALHFPPQPSPSSPHPDDPHLIALHAYPDHYRLAITPPIGPARHPSD